MTRSSSLLEDGLLAFESQDHSEEYQRLQEPFRTPSSATESSLIRKELLLKHWWSIFFQEVGNMESRKKKLKLTLGMSEILSCPPLPISDDPSALPSPAFPPSSSCTPSCQFTPCNPLEAGGCTGLYHHFKVIKKVKLFIYSVFC